MSSSTRDRILDVAWDLLTAGGPAAASMSAIARAADLSRQAVYFHFPDRSSLFVALIAHIDDHRELQAWAAKIESAPTGVEKLRLMFATQARRNPTFAPVARVIEAARHVDDAAAAAWRSATDDRRAFCRRTLLPALDADGDVDPGWDLDEASAVVAEMTSFRTWDDLVAGEGLAADRYELLMTATCVRALRAPPGEV